MAIKVATDQNFEELVIKADRPVVVDFWATWCGPCKMVAPEMEKIAAKYEGRVDVVKVDVDANPNLSRMFNIMSIPTIAFFKGAGTQPVGAVGFQTAEQLEAQQRAIPEFRRWRERRPRELIGAQQPDAIRQRQHGDHQQGEYRIKRDQRPAAARISEREGERQQ